VVRTLLVAVALCVVGACQSSTTLPPQEDFTLTDHHGQAFSLSSLRGRAVLVFFGYSHCPDVCPTTLSKLSSVSRRLGADRDRMSVVYVSVDPARDTPEVLKADLGFFDLNAVGVTGPTADIDRVVAQFGAKYEIVRTPDSAGQYAVNHSTTLYALDRDGRIRTRFAYEATVDEIVDGVREILRAQ
jgi:protein SCO1/2